MVENIMAVALLITFALYARHSASLVDKVGDLILLDKLTLKQAVLKLSLFEKIMLFLELPLVVLFTIVIYVFNWMLYHNVSK